MLLLLGSGCAHKAIIGKYPITAGRGIFELTLNQRAGIFIHLQVVRYSYVPNLAGCYDGIGLVDPKFKVQQDHIIGVFPNSYGLGLYAGTHVATSNRRIQVPSFGAMKYACILHMTLIKPLLSFSVVLAPRSKYLWIWMPVP